MISGVWVTPYGCSLEWSVSLRMEFLHQVGVPTQVLAPEVTPTALKCSSDEDTAVITSDRQESIEIKILTKRCTITANQISASAELMSRNEHDRHNGPRMKDGKFICS